MDAQAGARFRTNAAGRQRDVCESPAAGGHSLPGRAGVGRGWERTDGVVGGGGRRAEEWQRAERGECRNTRRSHVAEGEEGCEARRPRVQDVEVEEVRRWLSG